MSVKILASQPTFTWSKSTVQSHLFLFLLFFTLNKEMLAGLAEVTIAECSENKPIEIN